MWNLPLNCITATTANDSAPTASKTDTCPPAGIDAKRQLKHSFIPSARDINRSGRSTRISRIAFKAANDEVLVSISDSATSRKPVTTMKQSKQFQPVRK
jgi:hypothetical protein